MNLHLLQTEFMVLGLALAVFFMDLLGKIGGSKRAIGWFTAAGLAAIIVCSLAYPVVPAAGADAAFGGMFLADGLARVFKLVFLVSALLAVLASLDYLDEARVFWQGEYYFLMLMVTLAMMFIASAGDMLSLYVALELNTIGFYVLVSMLKHRGVVASETGLKYLILGALASAALLYGISILYGVSGVTSLSGLLAWLKLNPATPLSVAALVFVMAGFAFKVSLVPFHAWAPDVYQGAPTPVTAFLSVASKAAGFAAISRVFLVAFEPLSTQWIQLLMILAVLTFILANVVALKQSNIKRLLAYSSIAQAGTMALAVLAENAPIAEGARATHTGIYSLVYYLIVYVFTNMAAFTVATRVAADAGGDDGIDAFKGLASRSPTLALVMMMSMFSLAGIPPFGGFFSKFYVYMAGIEAGYFLLVTFSVMMSIVSLFYYLVVVKRMYLEDPLKPEKVASSMSVRAALLISALMMTATGVYPAPFMSWIKAALQLG